MTHALSTVVTIADGQADNQWQTSNDADAAVANALADVLTVDFSGGNVTLTNNQFSSAMTFAPSGLSTTRNLTVPALKRALFYVNNTDTVDTINVVRGATSIAVAAGQIGAFITDGTANGLWGAILTSGTVGVASSRQIISGAGLTGGGDLSADRTLAVGAGTGITVNADDVAIDKATDAEVRSAASNQVLTADLIESASALVTLTDASTIALDWDAGINRALTITDNRTLGNPTNGQPGTWRTIIITQDGTGSRTLAYDTQYKFPGGTEPVLTTAAASVDVLNILCVTSSNFYVFFANDMKT